MRRRPRLSARRESSLLLTVAILVLVLLSIISLASYRGALESWRQHEHLVARRLADGTARSIVALGEPSSFELRRLAPLADRVALLDSQGRVVAASGGLGEEEVARAAVPPASEERSASRGPDATTGGRVIAWSPLVLGGKRMWLRAEILVPALASQLRVAAVLTWLVVGVDFLLTLLLLAYLRRLFAPYDELLSRARAQSALKSESGVAAGDELPHEETEQMVAALRRAMRFIEKQESEPPLSEDEIAAVSRMLGPTRETGVLVVDRDRRVLSLNPAGAALLGVDSPASGEPLSTALTGAPEVVRALEQASRTQRPIDRLEVRQEQPRATLGLTVQLLRRDDGAVKGLLALFADASATRQAQSERQLALTLAQLGELAAGVAHELRNSLATINGYLTLIERRPEEGTLADYLGEVRTESDRLQRVVNDFLTFARPGTAQPQPVSLTGLVERAIADPALSGAPIELHPVPSSSPVISGDPVLLAHALRNLLTNAAAAQRPSNSDLPVEVSVEAGREGEWVVAIRDRGPGLPPQVKEHLFQPFVSGDASGVGLGLALAYRIIDLHGGQLRLEEREGGGTEALIFLPSGINEANGNVSASAPTTIRADGGNVNECK